jgi:hypothetical protein
MGAMKDEFVGNRYDDEGERLEDYDSAMCGGEVTSSYLNY